MRLRKIESQLREDRDRADSRYREAEMRLEKARARLDAPDTVQQRSLQH